VYLIDTNIWLERLLDQEQSAQVGQFLASISADHLLISDFSLHSIGVILCRLDRQNTLLQFVRDLFADDSVHLVSVQPAAMDRLVSAAEQFNLDFDDAYQYTAAAQANAEVISFDNDFDRTDRGRQTPAQILARADR
jgi:predicted nucleic acid-binding protein